MERTELKARFINVKDKTAEYLAAGAMGGVLLGMFIIAYPFLTPKELYSFLKRRFNPKKSQHAHTDTTSIEVSQPTTEPPPFSLNWTKFSEEHTDPNYITGIRIVTNLFTARRFLGRRFQEDDNPALQYLTLGKTPLRFAAIDRQSGTTEYFGVLMTLMDGKILNKILLSNATYKGYGLDYGDIYNDWGAIDSDAPDMKERKRRHEQMGLPWLVFDRDRLLFRFIIGRDQMPQLNLPREEPRPMILAVMRWVSGPQGSRLFMIYLIVNHILNY